MLTTLRRDEEVDLNTYLKKWNLLQTSLAVGKAWSQITEDTLKNSWNKLLKDVRTRVPDPEPSPAAEEETTPEVREWLEEEVPTGAELTEAAIVEAILHPEPEIVEVPEEPEDEQPDRRATFSLNESIAVSEQLLETLMTYDDFSSTDSLYFSSLIDRLQKKRQTSKQSTLDSFLMRLNKC